MVKDKFHNHVREALEKDGWTITHDPLKIQVGQRRGYIDLGAERMLIAAERGTEKIAVEVKTFQGLSDLHDFENAAGQFIIYLYALSRSEPERTLFLAIPTNFYDRFFQDFFFRDFARDYGVNILVFDETKRQITAWIK
jgi:XisH protein